MRLFADQKRLLASALAMMIVVCCLSFTSVSLVANAENTNPITEGALKYSDESHYEGSLEWGKIRTGNGTFTWSTGEVYEGMWEKDIQNGQGKMTWPGLGEYEGHFVDGKREGQGTFTWIYEGTPETGKPVSYQGQWTNDQIGPVGTMTFAGLGIYEGDFSKNARSGVGRFIWDNGDEYYGSWSDDKINGTGVFTASDGTVLEGTFVNNVLNKGVASYLVNGGKAVRDVQGGKSLATVSIVYDDGTTVSGKLKGDVFTGNVNITYASGDTYVGTISNGVKNGKGTYTWKNGAHYVGEWVNDKMSGKGKYCYTSNDNVEYLSGTFLNGSPSGKLIYMSEKKLRYETTWSNGKCVDIKYKK